MPPHLHPRSHFTTSLFGTTLVISFLVVGMPHILPCPAPRIAYADGDISDDGRKRRRKRQKAEPDQPEEAEQDSAVAIEERQLRVQKEHECPVPKPRGYIGEVLGFGRGETPCPRPKVQVKTREPECRQDDGD